MLVESHASLDGHLCLSAACKGIGARRWSVEGNNGPKTTMSFVDDVPITGRGKATFNVPASTFYQGGVILRCDALFGWHHQVPDELVLAVKTGADFLPTISGGRRSQLAERSLMSSPAGLVVLSIQLIRRSGRSCEKFFVII